MTATGKCYPYPRVITEIWINSQPCKGINLTTWHMHARKAPRVATVHDAVKESGWSYLALVPSSMHMPWWTHRRWPDTIPYNIHKEVRYHPTRRRMKLLSLRDPIKSRMRQYITQTCSSGPDDRSLTDTGRGYHLEALNFRSDHSSSFQSCILPFPLIAPPDLQLRQPFDHLAKPHRTSIDRKGPITSGFQPLVFYR
jgi:hypothetical protein